MSKYNNMKSIPIDSLNEEELKKAIKEWAEGDDSMEKLLWTCKLKNVETTGCHAGAQPYISFCVNDSKEEIIKLINVIYKKEESQILITSDGGNPFSGPKWFAPGIMLGINTLYKDKADAFFNELSDALLSNKKVNNDDFVLFSKIIDLYNFFIEKESCINYRIRHLQLNNYIFTAEVIARNRDFNYFNELFTKAGFTLDETCKIDIKKQWKIENSDKNILEEKLKNAISFIIDNYSLSLPTKESEIENFTALAHFKMREFGNTDEGIKKFNDWLVIKRKERDKKLRESSKKMDKKF